MGGGAVRASQDISSGRGSTVPMAWRERIGVTGGEPPVANTKVRGFSEGPVQYLGGLPGGDAGATATDI